MNFFKFFTIDHKISGTQGKGQRRLFTLECSTENTLTGAFEFSLSLQYDYGLKINLTTSTHIYYTKHIR